MDENGDIVFEFDFRSQPELGKSLNDKDFLLRASRNVTKLDITLL